MDKILLTHGHYDHILGAKALMDATGAKLYIGREDMPMLQDIEACLYDPGVSRAAFSPLRAEAYGDSITAAGIPFEVISTPGHSRGSVCLYNPDEKVIFTGDTLFLGSYGRTDFPGGSTEELKNSLKKLLALEGDYRILPGHNRETNLDSERVRNIFIRRM